MAIRYSAPPHPTALANANTNINTNTSTNTSTNHNTDNNTNNDTNIRYDIIGVYCQAMLAGTMLVGRLGVHIINLLRDICRVGTRPLWLMLIYNTNTN